MIGGDCQDVAGCEQPISFGVVDRANEFHKIAEALGCYHRLDGGHAAAVGMEQVSGRRRNLA
jgi:hypothetical protein